MLKHTQSILKTYLKTCRPIFQKYRSKISNVVTFPGVPESSDHYTRTHFETAIKEAENLKEFDALVSFLSSEVLDKDLDSLQRQEEKRRQKLIEKAKAPKNIKDIGEWRREISTHATHRFLINTGTYYCLWLDLEVDESNILQTLQKHLDGVKSDYVRLFVFDGFCLFDDKKILTKIDLPVGEMKVYPQEELAKLLRLPQSSWNHVENPEEIVKRSILWHILTVHEKEDYRGITGLWLSSKLVWPDMGQWKRESDINFIGPMFLCIGQDANLAEEIQIRTNIFDSVPIISRIRNDYLPWDSYDENGNALPRRWVKRVGKEGITLRNVFEVWETVNNLEKKGFLKFPTETYVRAVMNWHKQDDRTMDVFVSLVTAMESVLNPSSSMEINYKTSIRGAALLAHDQEERLMILRLLKEVYNIRSKIVHEGHTENKDLDQIIDLALMEIVQHVLLKYTFMIYFGLTEILPKRVLSDSSLLKDRSKRAKVISNILDAFVLDPSLTIMLEENLKKKEIKGTQEWKKLCNKILNSIA